MRQIFVAVQGVLGVPIAEEKMVWGSVQIVFLGILLEFKYHWLAVPEDKWKKAVQLLEYFATRQKTTVKEVQRLAGLLNFLNRTIHLGRVFTRRIYAKTSAKITNLKPHHHMRIDEEFKADCAMWFPFLTGSHGGGKIPATYRPFINIKGIITAEDVSFYTDASANKILGFGGVLKNTHWFYNQWEQGFVDICNPSIEYLELYIVLVGLNLWAEHFQNSRIVIHCDNMAVVGMVNKTSSSCRRCMHLLRLLVLNALKFNFRVYTTYVNTR